MNSQSVTAPLPRSCTKYKLTAHVRRDADEQHDISEDEVVESRLLEHLEANYALTSLYLIIEVNRIHGSIEQRQQIRDATCEYLIFAQRLFRHC